MWCRPPPSSASHEAGWAHAESGRGPSWLREPADPNALVPLLWSSTARKNDDGALEVGGVDLRELVAEHGSPAYVLDEHDFRARARAFREGTEGKAQPIVIPSRATTFAGTVSTGRLN